MDTVGELLSRICSWPVFGVVLLILFRKPITHLLERFAKAEHGKAKIGPIELDIGGIPASEGVETSSPEDAQRAEAPPKAVDPKPDEQTGDPISGVLDSLFARKDFREAQRLLQEEAGPKLPDNERLTWEALVLRYSHHLGDVSAIDRLEKLAKEKADVPAVTRHFALRLREMGEFERARELFMEMTEHYDKQQSSQRRHVVQCYADAAQCIALSGKYEQAIGVLKNLLCVPDFTEEKGVIFAAMADIAKESESTEDFVCYAESALAIDARNSDLRFSLAYHYSNRGYERLALLHYKRLIDVGRNAMALNNLGVSYGKLGLKTKSVASYLAAGEDKETLALANLAFAYIDAGFVDDARRIVEKANRLSSEGVEVSPRVGSVSDRVKRTQEEDQTKERKLLDEARKEQQFLRTYAHARMAERSLHAEELGGPWEAPWGQVTIKLGEHGSFEVRATQRIEGPSYSLGAYRAFSALGMGQPTKRYEERDVCVEGQLCGASAQYSIKIGKKGDALLACGSIYNAHGYMVINDTCDLIETMDKTVNDETQFVQWRKLRDPSDSCPGVSTAGP